MLEENRRHMLMAPKPKRLIALDSLFTRIIEADEQIPGDHSDRPMAVTWRLHRSMPTEIYLAARAAVA